MVVMVGMMFREGGERYVRTKVMSRYAWQKPRCGTNGTRSVQFPACTVKTNQKVRSAPVAHATINLHVTVAHRRLVQGICCCNTIEVRMEGG